METQKSGTRIWVVCWLTVKMVIENIRHNVTVVSCLPFHGTMLWLQLCHLTTGIQSLDGHYSQERYMNSTRAEKTTNHEVFLLHQECCCLGNSNCFWTRVGGILCLTDKGEMSIIFICMKIDILWGDHWIHERLPTVYGSFSSKTHFISVSVRLILRGGNDNGGYEEWFES